MATVLSSPSPPENFAELLDRLGNIPPRRIRLHPPPGTATEADVLATARPLDKRVCELIDGVLVEKAMGYRESLLAVWLIRMLDDFARSRNLGLVTGEQGMLQLFPGRVRIPDVAFVSWDRLPGRRVPAVPIPHLAPDLAVEILSPSNTTAEMVLKRQDYFAAGARLVWEVDPDARTVSVYTSSTGAVVLTVADTLDGGAVLPGFTLAVRDLFAELDRRG